jgi:hypothetical protein
VNNTIPHVTSGNIIVSSKNSIVIKEEQKQEKKQDQEHKQKPKLSNDIYKVFYVKPDIQNDIYYLYHVTDSINTNSTCFSIISKYIAHIPDYKTSVFMNKLFRNIKENDNLDAIEESDNEEEFEDSREDKYVYLDRAFKMKCEYNNKFKRWVPISLAGEKDRIVTISSLKNY